MLMFTISEVHIFSQHQEATLQLFHKLFSPNAGSGGRFHVSRLAHVVRLAKPDRLPANSSPTWEFVQGLLDVLFPVPLTTSFFCQGSGIAPSTSAQISGCTSMTLSGCAARLRFQVTASLNKCTHCSMRTSTPQQKQIHKHLAILPPAV